MNPPVARQIPHLDNWNNQQTPDQYYWLREKENQAVIDYLNEENAYTESVMADTTSLQDTLYQEMVGRIQETDLSVPVKKGEFYYYYRTEEGKNYPIWCRKKGDQGMEEILLDGNALAEGKAYFSLGAYSISDDHRLLAYSADYNGSEQYDIYVKDLETGTLLPDHIAATGGPVVWAADNSTFYYVELDATHRPYRLKRHLLGANPDTDYNMIEDTDERFFLHVSRSRSGKYIILSFDSKITSEVWFLDAHETNGSFHCIRPRVNGVEYSVSHQGDYFYILNNENAVNFQLFRCLTANYQEKSAWSIVIPHDDKVMLEQVDTFDNHIVVSCRKDGYSNLMIQHIQTQEWHDMVLPEVVHTVSVDNNPEYQTNVLRFSYSSLITPGSVLEYNMDSRERKLLKETPVLGGYDRNQYHSELKWATAGDGTQIPVSIVYRKDTVLHAETPCLLYGYGSYGISIDPNFSSLRLSLLDRGFVFAIAHIRGGGEMGRKWYEDGKFLKKQNTFNDFIAAAEMLIAAGYTSSSKLIIRGGSAGGLLMGAVINMRPDLFTGACALVPFVDVMNTMMDESIPLTVTEYEEWGNPHEEVYYNYMKSYSPYDNVKEQAYPNLLITAGLNDPRVQYWEPAKWCAKLRTCQQGNNKILLKTNMGAGHGGASGRYEMIKETAFEYAFMLSLVAP